MALFRSLGLMQTCIFPGFKTATKLLIHGVDFSTFAMIPLLFNSCNFCFNFSFSATGARRGECCTGGIF